VEAQAAKYVKQNELGIVEQAGVGLNANTSTEATRYFYSFPANKLELWMSLSQNGFWSRCSRVLQEKDVILEERRLQWITLHWSDGGGVVG